SFSLKVSKVIRGLYRLAVGFTVIFLNHSLIQKIAAGFTVKFVHKGSFAPYRHVRAGCKHSNFVQLRQTSPTQH
ncbi:hypothetical protein QYF50_11030, partial [Paenibacillus vini]|uniref:hypothetical protein n=1 Tax=Paenibacillus vini TaxID=1476024 RepID=UPI0025B66E65